MGKREEEKEGKGEGCVMAFLGMDAPASKCLKLSAGSCSLSLTEFQTTAAKVMCILSLCRFGVILTKALHH